MLEEFMGIPVHPLLVHAPVVFVPLLALLTAAYALVPFVRPHTRWVLGLLAIGAPISALLAKLSGEELFDRLDRNGQITVSYYPKLETHQGFGTNTLYASIVLGVLALALVLVVAPRGVDARIAPRLGPGMTRILPIVLMVLAVIAAAVALYYVIRTGDSGSKAVWTGL